MICFVLFGFFPSFGCNVNVTALDMVKLINFAKKIGMLDEEAR